MKRSLLHKFSYAVWVAMPFVAAGNALACGEGSSTITNLPALGFSYQVFGLNPNGALCGFFYNFSHPPRAFTYQTGALTDLGTFGGSLSLAYAINSAGEVTGQADLSSATHAFLYSNGVLKDLGTLGGSYSSGSGINDSGQIAGESYLAGDTGPVAFLYANGSMASLGTLGGDYSSAFNVNKSGMVIGESSIANNDIHGFVYSGGTMSDLGTLGGNYSSAFALNDAGLIVGESAVASGDTHGFVYLGGSMTDLGTFGGSYSSASAVNTNGQVVGVAYTANDAETHGFLYDHGTMTDLGTLGGNFSSVWTLNNLGQIVGDSALANGTQHAFLWRNGSMVDLNTLLPANSGWELTSAQLINDSGRIVGYGNYGGTMQWFVMDLVTGNSSPVANAGPNQTVDCQAQVTLNGSASSDPDNDPLTFEWSLGGSLLGKGSVLTTSLPMGTNVVTLTVADTCGASSQANVVVTVADSTPPTGSCPADMTASADGNCQAAVPDVASQVVASDNCTPRSGLTITQDPVAGTLVSLGSHPISIKVTDGSGNSASCSMSFTVVDTTPPAILSVPGPLTVSAGLNCQGVVPNVLGSVVASDSCTPASQLSLSQSPSPGTLLSAGQYTIVVKATDASGNSSSANVSLKVADTTPPVIHSLTASPNSLSPPNHQLVPVTISAVVSDTCTCAPVSKIISVTCNESLSPGEVQITGNLTVSLAASRDSSGTGRVYTITVQSADDSGNTTTGTVTVIVPKSNGIGNGTGTSVVKKK